MVGQPLEVDHGHPPRLQFQKQLGFAAAGAAPKQAQGPGLLKQVQNPVAIGLVAPFQHHHRQIQALG